MPQYLQHLCRAVALPSRVLVLVHVWNMLELIKHAYVFLFDMLLLLYAHYQVSMQCEREFLLMLASSSCEILYRSWNWCCIMESELVVLVWHMVDVQAQSQLVPASNWYRYSIMVNVWWYLWWEESSIHRFCAVCTKGPSPNLFNFADCECEIIRSFYLWHVF